MYKLIKDSYTGNINSVQTILDNGLSMTIPFNPDNTDYQAYLKWVSEGNTPLPAEGTE